MFVGPPPTVKVPQPPYEDKEIRQKVKEKIQRVIDNGYIKLQDIEEVKSLMYYFYVPKGEDDIRMVYNGSKSVLNKSLFAPWFNFPSSETMARWVLVGLWLGDNDFEDCWLNHELHPSLQKYCGIDISVLLLEMKRHNTQMLIRFWIKNVMGLFFSPFYLI